MNFADYVSLDGLGLAELVRAGEVTATELVEAAIRRADEVNPALNAIVHPMYEEAREQAAALDGEDVGGPFRGVPFLVKDLVSLVAGQPFTKGSRMMEGYVPDHDTELVRRYRASGVVLMGKTNAPELGLVPVTEPALFGPTRNPWDPERSPGGSSGGSAAAVAAGIVPLAGGDDGGGSIRIPASCCGLFGLKPTRGRVPTGPDYGELWRGAVVQHVLTRSVRDSAAMLDAVRGPDLGAPTVAPPPARPYLEEVGADPGRLRVALTTAPLLPADGVHDDCRAAVHDAAELLSDLGHRVVEDAPVFDGEAFAEAFVVMVGAELGADVRAMEEVTGRTRSPRLLEPETWALLAMGEGLDAETYAAALRTLEREARAAKTFFQDHDLLLSPTLAQPPLPIGTFGASTTEKRLVRLFGSLGMNGLIRRLAPVETLARDAFDYTPWTPVFNVTGQPAMSVPLFWNGEGLPIGVHLAARFGDEATLFRVAAQLEEARPWAERRPPSLSPR